MDLEIPKEPDLEMAGGDLYGTGDVYLSCIGLILTCGKVEANPVLKPETADSIIAMRWATACDARLSFRSTRKKAPTGRPARSLRADIPALG
jgi:hypothetical protein